MEDLQMKSHFPRRASQLPEGWRGDHIKEVHCQGSRHTLNGLSYHNISCLEFGTPSSTDTKMCSRNDRGCGNKPQPSCQQQPPQVCPPPCQPPCQQPPKVCPPPCQPPCQQPPKVCPPPCQQQQQQQVKQCTKWPAQQK